MSSELFNITLPIHLSYLKILHKDWSIIAKNRALRPSHDAVFLKSSCIVNLYRSVEVTLVFLAKQLMLYLLNPSLPK